MMDFDQLEKRALALEIREQRERRRSLPAVRVVDAEHMRRQMGVLTDFVEASRVERERAATAARYRAIRVLNRTRDDARQRPGYAPAAVSTALEVDLERLQQEQGERVAEVQRAVRGKMAAPAAQLDAAKRALQAARETQVDSSSQMAAASDALELFELCAVQAQGQQVDSAAVAVKPLDALLPRPYKALTSKLHALVAEARRQAGVEALSQFAAQAPAPAAAPGPSGTLTPTAPVSSGPDHSASGCCLTLLPRALSTPVRRAVAH